jgi:hypothetical protein
MARILMAIDNKEPFLINATFLDGEIYSSTSLSGGAIDMETITAQVGGIAEVAKVFWGEKDKADNSTAINEKYTLEKNKDGKFKMTFNNK